MLESGDEGGLAVLERVPALDPNFAAPSFEAVSAFRARRGESHEARHVAIKADELREKEAERYERLAELKPHQTFTPVGATPELLQEIARELPKMDRVVAAYAFRRTSKTEPVIFIDFIVLIAKPPLMITSEEDFLNDQAAKAYELLKDKEDLYGTVFTKKSPMAKRLRRDPQFQFYSSTESP